MSNFRVGGVFLLAIFLCSCSGIDKRTDAIAREELTEITNSKIKAQPLWQQRVGANIDDSSIILKLGHEGNIMLAAASKGNVVAVKDGVLLWDTDIARKIYAGPGVGDNKVVVGTDEGFLQTLDLKTGEKLWSFDLGSELLSSPVVNKGSVYVHTLDGGVTALNVDTGRLQWRFNISIPSLMLRRSSAPAVTDDFVLVGFSSGKLAAINKNDGTVDWTQDVSVAKGRSDISRMIDISADPVVYKNNVYVIGYQGNLGVYDIQSGNMLWQRQMSSISGLSVDSNGAYVSASNGEVWALGHTRGESLWLQKSLRGRILSKPAITSKYLVVADDEGYLHFMDKNTGHLIGRVNTGLGTIEAEPVVLANKIYVYSKSGWLKSFNIYS